MVYISQKDLNFNIKLFYFDVIDIYLLSDVIDIYYYEIVINLLPMNHLLQYRWSFVNFMLFNNILDGVS